MALDYIKKNEAERISGKKLDGRRKYFLWNGEVCFNDKFTGGCTGCMSDDEYSTDRIGSGCHECGYTGKSVQHYPVPVQFV